MSGQRPADVTYRDLRMSALKLAAGLREIGVVPGTRVAMQLPNVLEACICFQACAALGATLVPVLHLLRSREVEEIVADSRATVFVTAD